MEKHTESGGGGGEGWGNLKKKKKFKINSLKEIQVSVK